MHYLQAVNLALLRWPKSPDVFGRSNRIGERHSIRFLIVVLLMLASSASSHAGEISDEQIGEAVGAYVGAFDLVKRIKLSECGYAYLGDVNRMEQDILRNLKTKLDARKLSETEELRSSNFEKIDRLFREMLNASGSRLDKKTTCGIIVGIASTALSIHKDRFNALFNDKANKTP